MQPNRARVKYKSFYQRKNSKQRNLENFFDDDIVGKKIPNFIHSKKFEQMKRITLHQLK